jgi:hypothetical protein
MANPNPPTEHLKPFQPGQSGNPGGKTSAQRKLEVENAEKATRIRAALLAKMAELIDPESGLFMGDLGGDLLKLIKDSEDRGLGSPKTTIAGDPENPLGVSLIERVVIDKASD